MSVTLTKVSYPDLAVSHIVVWVPRKLGSTEPFAQVSGRRIRPAGEAKILTYEECRLEEAGNEYIATPVPDGKSGRLPTEARLAWEIILIDTVDSEKRPVKKPLGPYAQVIAPVAIRESERKFIALPTNIWSSGWGDDISEGLEHLEHVEFEAIREKILAWRRVAQSWRWPRALPKNGDVINCRLIYQSASHGGNCADVAATSIYAYPI